MVLKLTIQNKLTNYIMQDGEKQISEKLLLKSYKLVQKAQKKKNFKEIFKLALVNSSPFFYIKQIQRKKKKALEFPFLLKNSLKLHYGIKVILLSARIKSTFSFYKKCSLEIINSSKLMSEGVKKKKETYKTAFFTKRYANYRWF
jgi:ribosomal protein S7